VLDFSSPFSLTSGEAASMLGLTQAGTWVEGTISSFPSLVSLILVSPFSFSVHWLGDLILGCYGSGASFDTKISRSSHYVCFQMKILL
jgi:hypothetical protein